MWGGKEDGEHEEGVKMEMVQQQRLNKVGLYVCVCMHVYVHMYVCVYVYVCMYVFVYICVHVCMHINISILCMEFACKKIQHI